MKKKVFLIFVVFMFTLAIKAQISLSCYYNGYWGRWIPLSSLRMYGNYGGFILYDENDHPSEFIFKFKISNYNVPTKAERREHLKKK